MTTDPVPVETEAGGTLAYNVMHFVRGLRGAGLPAGPGKTIAAVRAVEAVDPTRRSDLYWALHAVLVERRDQHDIFDQAFHLFWREIRLQSAVQGPVMASDRLPQPEAPPASRRASEAIAPRLPDEEENQENVEIELDAVLTFSPQEVLQEMDFEDMSADELAEAKRAIAALRLPIKPVPTRRFRPDQLGRRIDMRATLRASLRSSGDLMPLKRRSRAERLPTLVVLCDVSGSMSRYSRMFLHFVHAVTNDRDRVHSFLFGTRLTNITRYLRHRDVDVAVGSASRAVHDWSGGTRIGPCLKDFNQYWSRRVLAQGALVLLITDGLDRDDLGILRVEVERLHKSCRRLIWLNPLLRYEGFKPEAGGVRTILPHIDDFRPVHNIASLMDIAAALSAPAAAEQGAAQG